jgi:2'-5' RNA ligase
MSRLFVAVVPPPEVLEDLEEFAEPRRSRDDPLTWSDPRRWHLTVAFLPAADEDRYYDLVEGLTAAAGRCQPFRLSISGAGTFPDPTRATVLWAGVSGEVEKLSEVAARSRTAAARAGIGVDGSRFQPHLTLARMKPPVEATRWLRTFELYQGPEWTVTDIELVESRLGGGSRRGGSHVEHQVRDVIALG